MIHHRDWSNSQGGCQAGTGGILRQSRACRRRRVGLGDGLEWKGWRASRSKECMLWKTK